MDKKRLLIPLPNSIASLSANIATITKPLLTEDQLKLLKYDNIKSGIYKTNYDLGIGKRYFKTEIDNTVLIGDQVVNLIKIIAWLIPNDLFSYRNLYCVIKAVIIISANQ